MLTTPYFTYALAHDLTYARLYRGLGQMSLSEVPLTLWNRFRRSGVAKGMNGVRDLTPAVDCVSPC